MVGRFVARALLVDRRLRRAACHVAIRVMMITIAVVVIAVVVMMRVPTVTVVIVCSDRTNAPQQH